MTIGLLQFYSVSGSSSFPSVGWQALPIGANGNITGLSIANDGTVAVRTDTYGAYVWNATATSPVNTTGSWQQVVNSNSMPGNFNANNQNPNAANGCIDIQVAYNSSSTMYMRYSSATTYAYEQVYKSTNRGQTWVTTAFAEVQSDPINSFKVQGPKMDIDPTNANTVYLGNSYSGVFYTTNGGSSWNSVATSAIPLASTDSGNYPGYTVKIGVFSSTQHVVVYSYGNGIYHTSNGASTWTHINSSTGPTTAPTWSWDQHAGNFYCTDSSGDVWGYGVSSGLWTEAYSGGGVTDVACDPNTANHIVISDGGGHLAESTATTPSFSTFSTLPAGQPVVTGDVLSLSIFNGINVQRLAFNPTSASTVYGTSNRGVYTTNWTSALSSSYNLGWQAQSRGIEQLVANCVVVPTSAQPYLGVWDSGLFKQPNLTSYPPISDCYPGAISIQMCTSIDFLPTNTNFVVAIVDGNGDDSNNPAPPAYTNNGGASWTSFTQPSNANEQGGNIAISTVTSVLYAPNIGPISYCTNFGSTPTWSTCTLPSDQTSWTSFSINTQHGGRYICADSMIVNKYYLFWPGLTTGELYSSTNGGNTWTSLTTLNNNSNDLNTVTMKATPGYSSDLWISLGGLLWHYSGSTASSMSTFFGTEGCKNLGFGVNPGGGYPSVFVTGFSGGSYPGTWGIYRSDNAQTGTSPTWNLVSNYPNNSFDKICDIAGDPGIPYQCYVAFSGSGFAYYNA